MNEEERAAWLARAVDKLIHGLPADNPPDHLDLQDLDDLLRTARARLELAGSTAKHGSQHEDSVWYKVLERLESQEAELPLTPSDAMSVLLQAPRVDADPELSDDELQELKEVAALRQHMSARMMAMAEGHREAVWHEIQARLAKHQSRKGIFALFRRDPGYATVTAAALEGLATGQTLWQSADSHTDELIELARERRELGLMARRASSRAQRRVWSRVAEAGQGIHVVDITPRAGPRLWWQRLAFSAAALALIVAAVGPIPATGLAGHPFARFIETVGDQVGVAESGAPPMDPGPVDFIEGTPATAAEASDMLGVSVTEPATVPTGYQLTASMYYPAGLTGSGGTFLLSYMSGNGSLLIFQEPAAGADLAVAAGAARSLTLADGTPATLFTGGWIPGPAGFSWTGAGAQSLIFERNGVRTVLQFIGDEAAVPDLTAVAVALR